MYKTGGSPDYVAFERIGDDLRFAMLYGHVPTIELRWEPAPGEMCPFCLGVGESYVSPKFVCHECDKTGRLPADWGTRHWQLRSPTGYHPRWVVK